MLLDSRNIVLAVGTKKMKKSSWLLKNFQEEELSEGIMV